MSEQNIVDGLTIACQDGRHRLSKLATHAREEDGVRDLIDRLQAWHDDWPAQEICREAAREIERLMADKDVERSQARNGAYEADIEQLRAELKEVADNLGTAHWLYKKIIAALDLTPGRTK
jgi:hypothetical protein